MKFFLISVFTLVAISSFGTKNTKFYSTTEGKTVSAGWQTSSSVSTYKIVSEEVFNSDHSNLKWMHIGRVASLNPDIDLKSINSTTDFSKIKFVHKAGENFAYRLYDGRFLVIKTTKK